MGWGCYLYNTGEHASDLLELYPTCLPLKLQEPVSDPTFACLQLEPQSALNKILTMAPWGEESIFNLSSALKEDPLGNTKPTVWMPMVCVLQFVLHCLATEIQIPLQSCVAWVCLGIRSLLPPGRNEAKFLLKALEANASGKTAVVRECNTPSRGCKH